MNARRWGLAVLLLAACRTSGPVDSPQGTGDAAAPTVDAARIVSTIETLAADDLGGRYTLHPDIDRAAEVIARQLEAAGVQPVGDTYRQPFDIIVGANVLQPPALAVGPADALAALPPEALGPIPGSASGSVEAELVFAGYATVAQDPAQYDDLAGLDLQDKIAVILLDAPRRPDLRALFARGQEITARFESAAGPLREANDLDALRKLYTQSLSELIEVIEPFASAPISDSLRAVPEDLSAGLPIEALTRAVMAPAEGKPEFGFTAGRLRSKLARLEAAGAKAVIAVRAPRSFLDDETREADDFAPLDGVSPIRALAMPVVQLKWREADRVLRMGRRKLSSIQGEIDRELQPQSGPMGMTARLDLKLEARTMQAPNVVGQIVGSSKPEEVVILGAHYDHIGTDEDGHGHCRAKVDGESRDTICNGADDNASGTAIVLEVARVLGATKPERTVVFALFAGEELGLLGSRALADTPPAAAPWTQAGAKAVAMVNIDMVGRLRPDPGLLVGGVGSSPQWMQLFETAGIDDMPILFDRSITTRSDHASFYKHEVPVIFMFTGVHGDYHAPGDESSKLDGDGLGKVANLTLGVVRQLSEGAPIDYAAPATPAEGLVSALPGDNESTIERRVGF